MPETNRHIPHAPPPVVIGGPALAVIAGPCAVESPVQVERLSRDLKGSHLDLVRGGAFKPRTVPTSFQGMGLDALPLLSDLAAELGVGAVTEVLDVQHVDAVADVASVLQVGARSMQNVPLLQAVAATGRPILLKRHFGATLDEFIGAAQYIRAAGNDQIILCERGIRTFEQSTRFTLDIAAIPLLRKETGLPVIVDPSHAAGRRDLVAALAMAGVSAGADGVMIEVHSQPDLAMSDGQQSITPTMLADLVPTLRRLAEDAAVQALRECDPVQAVTVSAPARHLQTVAGGAG